MKKHQKAIKNKLGKDIRSEKDYYSWMRTWTEVRDKKVEELAFKQGQESLNKTTFKPSINERSQAMMKKKKVGRVPIYEQDPKPRTMVEDKNCTFRPNLNKTAKK